MKLIKKRKNQRFGHRGIIGVEAAIVLIAFVIVAAALAFVVLNMGFSTTQKAKTTIVSTLQQAGSSLQVEGKIVGSGHATESRVNATGIPIKITSGGGSVNLAETTTAIKYMSNTITYDDIYQGTIIPGVENSLKSATATALLFSYIDQNPYVDNAHPTQTSAFIYWTSNTNNNDILDTGEHVVLAIVFAENDRPATLDTIRVEVIIAGGATLTVERQIPAFCHSSYASFHFTSDAV